MPVFRNSASGSNRVSTVVDPQGWLLHLRLPPVDIAQLHVGVDTLALQHLAHAHEEHLILVLGPAHDAVPRKQRVTCRIVSSAPPGPASPTSPSSRGDTNSYDDR